MRDIIITTEATSKFDSAVDEVLDSGKALSGFVLAFGQAGRGKSVAADRYHCHRGGAYIRVWENWTQTNFLQRLLFEVRGKNEADLPRHNANRCKEMIVNHLQREQKPLFIDEADRLSIGRVEDLRDIFEMTGAPIVLIGEEGLHGLLAERRRIWSRVVHEVEFGPIVGAEVSMYSMQAAGLDMTGDVSIAIAQKCEGDFRLVRNMLVLLEKAAKAQESSTITQEMCDIVFKARNWRRK